MNIYDRVTATFTPRRKDDLVGGADKCIGKCAEWMVAWQIEEGEYAGEYAMHPIGCEWPFAWVPSGDLTPIVARHNYFRRWGFSINEGAGPVNLHMQWFRPWCWLFVYIYICGRRFSWAWKRTRADGEVI